MPNNKFHEPREGRQGREVRNKVFTDYLRVLEYYNANAAADAEWEARYKSRQKAANYFEEVRAAGNAARRAAGLREWRENELPWEAEYEARRSRQEARSEAAATPVTPKAPPEPPRQYPLFPEAPRSPLKDRPRSEGNWGDLPPNNPAGFDPPATFTREERRQMYARERFARALQRDTRQKQAATDHAVSLCNRTIEDHFPLVPFSELEYIPTGPHYVGHLPEPDYSYVIKKRRNDE